MRPPARTLSAQQRRFDAFVEEFNWQRSHEALGRLTPASVHQPSPRPYPDRLPEVEYPSGVTVRRVRRTGEFKWRGRLPYLSTVLAKETIAWFPVTMTVGRFATALILWACLTSVPENRPC